MSDNQIIYTTFIWGIIVIHILFLGVSGTTGVLNQDCNASFQVPEGPEPVAIYHQDHPG